MKHYLFWYIGLWSMGSDFCVTNKSSTVGCLSRCCYQYVSQLLIKNFWTYPWLSYLQNSSFKNITKKVTEVVLIHLPFFTVGSKQKDKNELTEYHGIFMPFKSRVYSKHGSPIFTFFGSGKMVLYLHVWEKVKFLLTTLPWQT